MKNYLDKFMRVIVESEKKFDISSKNNKILNKLLYEYETLSLETYAPKGVNKNVSDLLLFENPDNFEIKNEFD